MKYHKTVFSLGGMLCLSAVVGVADSISPGSFSATLAVGESTTITKTFTVSAGTAAPKVDVYFLADTTGSMGGYLASVQSAATEILNNVAALGADVAFAAGEYEDFPTSPWGGSGDAPYTLTQAMTTSKAAAQEGINNWSLGWGNDGPESNLHALEQLAGSSTGWRTGSERILVWFGDIYGHDPAAESGAAYTPGYPGPSEATATAALEAAGIQVQALNVGYGGLDSTGQASRITEATGGSLYNGVSTSTIVARIQEAIATAVATYTRVGIDTSDVPAGVDVTVSPGEYVASGEPPYYDRSVSRDFTFKVTFTGVEAGTYDFDLYGTVDGGQVATESDRIVVTGGGGPTVPDAGSTVALLGLAVVGLGALRRKP